jgi:glycosyltransferase involved in cell wall biosynthesis
MNKVSCIIPAYNEAQRIRDVLDVVCGHQYVNEVIVINDGSKDNIVDILKDDKRINFISYTKNQGKAYAVLQGMQAAKNNLIMMLDSDLIGLTKEDLNNLILPAISNEVGLSISLRGNSLKIYKKLGIDIFSGERVFDKKILLENKDALEKLRYGLEVFMNSKIIKNNLKIKVVYMPNLSHARKQEKVGFIKGFFEELKMSFEVVKTVGIFKIINQFHKMLKLRI